MKEKIIIQDCVTRQNRAITPPTIHMNSTAPETLREAYLSAWRAVVAAGDYLRNAQPNGRDYYPTGDLSEAVEEHHKRLIALRQVEQDMEALCEFCADRCKD